MNKESTNKKPNITFFGSPQIAVDILEELKKSGNAMSADLMPSLIITQPNRKVGRKLVITPPPVKIWADENNIPTLQPEKLDEEFIKELKFQNWDLFIVAAYGKIISKEVLDIPKKGTLNVHPSLLPKYRGATPIHSPILRGDKETGVSIILLDEKMDHGPIINQEIYNLWENSITEMPTESQLEKTLSIIGGKLLIETIPLWLEDNISPQEQDHSKATFCDKYKPEDALIDLTEDAQKNFLKIQAFNKWPKAHYFENDKRILIKKARLENNKLIPEKILPEGGSEITLNN
ncbi:methionyl-tRNA formyltransferase [Patescibacteria group bacterium]|nr:methionyl-tRNA formyltransferase [Patescibacteria group bacterium]